jgi:hypothetical protein
MENASPVGVVVPVHNAGTNGFCLVFSAPKYCDSTENKGAYINIGPDYKLEFHKFDAVPHPDIKPMVSGLTG